MKPIVRNALPAGLLALLCACQGGSAAPAAGPSISLAADAYSIRADGSVANLTATCRDAAGNPGTGTVTFTAPFGTVNGGTTPSGTAALDSTGAARITYACNASTDSRCVAGKVFVSASWTSAANSQALTLTAGSSGTGSPGADAGTPPAADAGTPIPPHVTGPPASIIETSATPFVLGLHGSGIQEQGLMTFLVADSYGSPVAAATVNFAQAAPALLTLGHTTGTTDASGKVVVDYASGAEVGVTAIVATVAGTTLSASHPVAVRGAKPSAAGLYFRCAQANIPIYTVTTGLMTTTCTVRLSDRFGNRVGVATPVEFATEAGSISASAMTKPFDFSTPTDPDEGSVTVTFTADLSNGFGPADVAPLAAAPTQYPFPRSAPEPSRSNGQIVLNPRDQFVTLIAMVRGEEAFVDANHNGVYDVGELFVDQGDPYVDANDNNVYDALTEQRFCGGASCSTYNGPNGVWDSDRTIWAPTWVVFSGPTAAVPPAPPLLPATNCLDYSNNSVGNPSSVNAAISVVDHWLNTGALGTSYGASVSGSNAPGLNVSGNFTEPDGWGAMGALHVDFDWVRVAASDNTKGCGDPSVPPICVERLLFGNFDPGLRIAVSLNDATVLPKGGTAGNGCSTAGGAPPSAGTQVAPFALFVSATTNGVVTNLRIPGTDAY